MPYSLGEARGEITVDVKQAIAAYNAVYAKHRQTLATMAATSRGARTIGLALTGIGVAALGAFALATKKTAEFERSLAFFGAVTNSTAKEMELVRKKALELGQSTAFGAQQVADAFVELGKAGVSVKDLTSGVADATLQLAAAADISTEKAAVAIVNTMKTFGLAAKDAVYIADQMAGAANASTIDIQDMAVTMKYAGSAAAALKIPLDDVAAAIAILGNAGIRGSTAGTSLRRILLNLNPVSEKAAKVMKELGIITADGSNRFYDAQGNAKSLGEIFEILRQSTAGLSQEQKVAALNTIFGNRAISSALILTKGGAKAIKQYKDQIANVTAEEVMNKRLDNLSGSLKRFKAALDTAFISAGAPAQEPLKELVDKLTELINAFNRLDPEMQKLIVRTVLITGVIFTALGAFSLMVAAILRFVEAIIRVGAIVKFVAKLQLTRLAVLALRGALGSLFALLASNPIGWIVLAVIALGVAFFVAYKKIEVFRRFVDGLWQSLQVAWDQMLTGARAVGSFFVAMWDRTTAAARAAWAFLQMLGSGILAIFSKIPGYLAAFAGFMGRLPAIIGGAVSSALTWFASFASRIPYYLGYALGFVVGFALRVHNALLQMGAQALSAVISFFGRLPGIIWRFMQSAAALGIQAASSLASGVINQARRAISGIISFFQQLPARTKHFFTVTATNAIAAMISFASRALAQAGRIVHGILSFLSRLPGTVRSLFSQMVNAAISQLGRWVSAARSFAGRVVSVIRSTLGSLPGLVAGVVDRCIAAFKDAAGRAFASAKSFASGLWDGFKKGLFGSPHTLIEYAMWDMEANVWRSIRGLKTQMKTVRKLGESLPSLSTDPRTRVLAAGGGSTTDARVIIPPGAVQVTLNGDADAKTVDLIRDAVDDVLRDFVVELKTGARR